MPRLNMKKLMPAGLGVDPVGFDCRQIEIPAGVAKGWAAFPECGARSGGVHSPDRRRLADLPAHGFDVRVVVRSGDFAAVRASAAARTLPSGWIPA